jgi:hypothetical protein
MSTTTTTREFSLEGRALADLQQQLSAARVAAFEAKSVADFWQAEAQRRAALILVYVDARAAFAADPTAPAGAERTHLMDACKDSAGWAPCLFDLTPPEAWQHWRNIAHDQATELTAARAEAAALKADRDEWMASSAGYGSDMVEWKIRAQQAEATAARLREALEIYGWHRPSCRLRAPGMATDGKCDCGLRAALAAKEGDRG